MLSVTIPGRTLKLTSEAVELENSTESVLQGAEEADSAKRQKEVDVQDEAVSE